MTVDSGKERRLSYAAQAHCQIYFRVKKGWLEVTAVTFHYTRVDLLWHADH